eukprot:6424071-Amphidinium_carterae.1
MDACMVVWGSNSVYSKDVLKLEPRGHVGHALDPNHSKSLWVLSHEAAIAHETTAPDELTVGALKENGIEFRREFIPEFRREGGHRGSGQDLSDNARIR